MKAARAYQCLQEKPGERFLPPALVALFKSLASGKGVVGVQDRRGARMTTKGEVPALLDLCAAAGAQVRARLGAVKVLPKARLRIRTVADAAAFAIAGLQRYQ